MYHVWGMKMYQILWVRSKNKVWILAQLKVLSKMVIFIKVTFSGLWQNIKTKLINTLPSIYQMHWMWLLLTSFSLENDILLPIFVLCSRYRGNDELEIEFSSYLWCQQKKMRKLVGKGPLIYLLVSFILLRGFITARVKMLKLFLFIIPRLE